MDGEFNEPLPFANVAVKGTTLGTTTDFDGKFQIKIEPGTYTVVFSFIGYATVEMSDIVVNANKETFLQLTLSPAANQLDDIVIKTTSKKNSEASLLNLQKKSISLVDGLSIQSIKKSGDSNIAGAIKRVPGVSVQGGKYVYVRGLGDRYSKTTVNGMELPGLDPDRNTLPLDIFPTNLIDNLIVKKSASSEIGADFTGGTVDIKLKDFSYSPEYNVSFSAGYNPDMHFNDNFLMDDRSSSDWRAKDDGLRDLPIDADQDFPTALPLFPDLPTIGTQEEQQANAALLTDNTKKLNKTMAPNQETSDLNYSFGVSASNGYKFKEDGESSIGYIAAIGYKSNTTYYDNFQNGRFLSRGDVITEQEQAVSQLGTINNFVSLLFGISVKIKNHKFGINYIDLSNGESNASNVQLEGLDENVYLGEGSVITYTDRNLRSIPIYGAHTFGENGSFKVNWKLAKSTSKLEDKDFRKAIFEVTTGFDGNPQYTIAPSVTEAPTRLWRYLDEENFVAKLDFEYDIKTSGLSGKVKFGASEILKERDFSSKRIDINWNGGNSQILLGDPNAILADENIWVQSDVLFQATQGSYISAGEEEGNTYNSESTNTAAYLSTELKFSDFFKAVVGARFETYELNYTGIDFEGEEYNSVKFLDENELFTNVNLIFSPNDKSNIRASYYKTTARPSFKEASSVTLADPITETFFVGNPDIKSSIINNYDLRYEFYGEKNQMFAVSMFAKQFKDPIEIAVIRDDTPSEFTAKNNEKATVLGVELEVRKNILSLNDNFTLNFNANASYIDAKVTALIDENDITLGTEERELQGQSPFMINAGLNSRFEDIALEAGIFYNVQGAALETVGAGDIPDVYSEPFHNLDFSMSKSFDTESKVNKRLTFKVKNLLNEKRESYYLWNDEKAGLFRGYNPGLVYSLGVSLTF